VITRLSRVGYDHVIGYLSGGIDSWKQALKELDTIQQVTVEDLAKKQGTNGDIAILDVRKTSEFLSEHVIGAENAPLDSINDAMSSIDKNKTYYVHCAGGYRSMIFTSILRARGFENLIDVQGGFKAIKENKQFKVRDYICPTTML
jgi:rhodanese-related sulfurtransferase